MSRSRFSEAVQAGMEILDENTPGWESRIDPEILNLGSCQFCILGQIYGDYNKGKHELRIDDGPDFGFDAEGGSDRHYALLTHAWLRVIKKRLTSRLSRIVKRLK